MKYFEGTQEETMETMPAAVEMLQESEPSFNSLGYLTTNELKFSGGQVRLGRISYFN